jgi:hypothetical protein
LHTNGYVLSSLYHHTPPLVLGPERINLLTHIQNKMQGLL